FPALRSAASSPRASAATPVVILWAPGTASALDATVIADARDVGAAGVFDPRVDGRPLTFRFEWNRFLDAETGSEWTVLGKAIAGPLAGRALRPIVHGNHFWFAWAAFRPQARLYRP
ncbi:MAG: DUF3179 domain-containing protein, partial [Armatimonadetes bacterium]|nr:DUF3179 domain-containing protein [Armatimonadota bacterium]